MRGASKLKYHSARSKIGLFFGSERSFPPSNLIISHFSSKVIALYIKLTGILLLLTSNWSIANVQSTSPSDGHPKWMDLVPLIISWSSLGLLWTSCLLSLHIAPSWRIYDRLVKTSKKHVSGHSLWHSLLLQKYLFFVRGFDWIHLHEWSKYTSPRAKRHKSV